MQLTGNQIFKSSATPMWNMLMDPEVLSRVIPGVSKLEKLSENAYRSILNIKLGPVNGLFSGNVQLVDIIEPHSFRLKAQQNSKIGNADVDVLVKLVSLDDAQTEVAFDGDAKISGVLATIGQRVLGGAASTLTKQFFKNFEKELASKERHIVK